MKKDDVMSWNRFTDQARKDARLWLFCVTSLLLYRGVFIVFFRSKVSDSSTLLDVLRVFSNGLRYDAITATICVLPPFLLSVGNVFAGMTGITERFRRAWGEIYCILFAGACVVTINYFKEFNDQFNHFIVNLHYDNTKAIFLTIWSEYHVVENVLIIGILTAVTIPAMRYILDHGLSIAGSVLRRDHKTSKRPFIVLACALVLIGGIGISLARDAGQPKHSDLKNDEFLQKSVVNPFVAFYDTAHDFFKDDDTRLDEFLPDRNIALAAQKVFGSSSSYHDLDRYLQRTAPGPENPPARHIFLVVMESFDSWPLMKKYESLHLADNLKRLTNDGISVQHFLPAAENTLNSLSAIITGLPYTSMEIYTQNKTYPTSPAVQLRRLGYQTNFFYGGDISWMNMVKFLQVQGFDRVYSARQMTDKAFDNVWGIDDEHFFDFVLRTLDDSRPTFNLILTSSYHSPFNVDVYGKGFSLKRMPADHARDYDNTVSLKTLGHLWYSDLCIGSFVKKAEKTLPHALFAFTGDHASRRYVAARPDFYERSAVPFILYGKQIIKGLHVSPETVGSHIDIGPTLIELTAPKDFLYHAVGTSLFSAEHSHLGIGWNKVIGPDFLVDVTGQGKIYPIPDRSLPDPLPDLADIKTLHNRVSAISWWRVLHGSSL